MKWCYRAVLAGIFLFFSTSLFSTDQKSSFLFKSDTALLELAFDGTISSFQGADGTSLIEEGARPPFAVLRQTKDSYVSASTITENSDGTFSVGFNTEQGGMSALFRIEAAESFFTIEVLRVDGGDWYGLLFAEMPPADTGPDGYGVTAVSMAPGSVPISMPGMTKRPGGKTYAATLADGAKIALVTAKKSELRKALQQALSAIPKGIMPVSAAGGPWAEDIEKNHGNYIIYAEPIPNKDASRWIEHLKKYGVNQLDLHQGRIFRQGDFVYNEDVYPNGTADFRVLSDAFREAGILTGLHTYAEFIDPKSKYISPIPHPDLASFESFTLTNDLSIDANSFNTEEPTANVSLLTGFMETNSLYLRIDDELIKYGQTSKEAPFGFFECERGALGTSPAPHKAGAKIEHLTNVYQLFAPKPGSPLFYEIARETARAYNEGGYSMIYLDAFDGTGDIVDDGELIWYYQTKFVNELIQNCDEPPLLEYSTMDNNIWMARSRAGAMDSPYRGHRKFFIDHLHRNAEGADAVFLPGQLGWLALSPASGDTIPGFQKKPLFPEDIHFLGAKLLAHRYGYSILDAYLDGAAPAAERCGEILARYEKLKTSKNLDEKMLEKLKDENLDVILLPGIDGNDWPFPVTYSSFEMTPESSAAVWENPGKSQIPYVRIENRFAADLNSDERISIIKSDGEEMAEGRIELKFDPPLDLSKQSGFFLDISADENGGKVNLQLESPHHLLSGHLDHIAKLEPGIRQQLVFAEANNGEEALDPSWEKCRQHYSEFREVVHYNTISEIFLLVSPKESVPKIWALDAVPIRSTFLINPVLEFGGKRICFEGAIPSGHYLEYDPQAGNPDEARVLNPTGALLATIPVTRDFESLPPGSVDFKLFSETWDSDGRVKVTLRGITSWE